MLYSKGSEYVRLNVIHSNDIVTPARVPPNKVNRKLYHHKKGRKASKEGLEYLQSDDEEDRSHGAVLDNTNGSQSQPSPEAVCQTLCCEKREWKENMEDQKSS